FIGSPGLGTIGNGPMADGGSDMRRSPVTPSTEAMREARRRPRPLRGFAGAALALLLVQSLAAQSPPPAPRATPRLKPSAVLLDSGEVLVTGGFLEEVGNLASAEVYLPASGRWISPAPMSIPRTRHTATQLPSGMLLVAGGADGNGTAVASAALYDP